MRVEWFTRTGYRPVSPSSARTGARGSSRARLKKGETLPSVTDEQRQQILRSVSDILTLEIQKTFDFFRATASGENIQRIVVAGGTARVPGLVDLLREEFAMPVEELNPFRKVLINPSKHSDDQIREMAPRLAIAVGLALRSFD